MSGCTVVKGEPLVTLEKSTDHSELVVRAPCDGSLVDQNIRKEQRIIMRVTDTPTGPKAEGDDNPSSVLAFTMRVSEHSSDFVIHEAQLTAKRAFINQQVARHKSRALHRAAIRQLTRHGAADESVDGSVNGSVNGSVDESVDEFQRKLKLQAALQLGLHKRGNAKLPGARKGAVNGSSRESAGSNGWLTTEALDGQDFVQPVTQGGARVANGTHRLGIGKGGSTDEHGGDDRSEISIDNCSDYARTAEEAGPSRGLLYFLGLPFSLAWSVPQSLGMKLRIYLGNAGNIIEFVNIVLFFIQIGIRGERVYGECIVVTEFTASAL